MKTSYVRIYNDDDGESHFETIEVEQVAANYAPPAPSLNVSEPGQAVRWQLVTGEAGWDGNWHPSPVRQFMIGMSGEFEVEASDGERRTFRAGEVLLLEDTEGKGHYTRVPKSGPGTVFAVHL